MFTTFCVQVINALYDTRLLAFSATPTEDNYQRH